MEHATNKRTPGADVPVYLETGGDKLAAMHNLILRSGLLKTIAACWIESKKNREDFSIVIKPAVDHLPNGASIDLSTDPELVDCLIAEISREGFPNITILSEKEPAAGHYFASIKSTGHKTGIMGGDKTLYDFGSFLGRHPVSTTWHDADFRISFAKNRTDKRIFYHGSISNINFDPVAPIKKAHSNGHHVIPAEVQVLLVDRLPVHFGLLDAWISADGGNGTHIQNTKTLMASENLLALDWVAGEKMNLNPAYNTVVQEAMYRWGTVKIVRLGNMTPWAGWKNPAAFTVLLNNLFYHN
jgi:uncharacterized protein (DUF362 family)